MAYSNVSRVTQILQIQLECCDVYVAQYRPIGSPGSPFRSQVSWARRTQNTTPIGAKGAFYAFWLAAGGGGDQYIPGAGCDGFRTICDNFVTRDGVRPQGCSRIGRDRNDCQPGYRLHTDRVDRSPGSLPLS